MTINHKIFLKNSSSAAVVYTLPNTIIYLKAIKYEYHTEADLLKGPET